MLGRDVLVLHLVVEFFNGAQSRLMHLPASLASKQAVFRRMSFPLALLAGQPLPTAPIVMHDGPTVGTFAPGVILVSSSRKTLRLTGPSWQPGWLTGFCREKVPVLLSPPDRWYSSSELVASDSRATMRTARAVLVDGSWLP